MTPWEQLLEQPLSGGHFVQLYQADETALALSVGHYLWTGLKKGDGAILIVTPEHKELISRQLEGFGANVEHLTSLRQLVILDAAETLALFMVDGEPNWFRFQKAIRGAMAQVRTSQSAEGLRAYGEMVAVLWKSRQFHAANRVEQLWNRLLEQSAFSLFCSYAIDLFGSDIEVNNLDGVFCTHTHILPSQPNGMLETALNQALDEAFGTKADAMRVLMQSDRRPVKAIMPTAESTVLWLRKNLPDQAEQIIGRARQHYDLLVNSGGSSSLQA